uniref:Uncharacterized protein n=1 Tax=Mustela putorius furo TaxID=9669 RepID=M3XWS5_MUSPF
MKRKEKRRRRERKRKKERKKEREKERSTSQIGPRRDRECVNTGRGRER